MESTLRYSIVLSIAVVSWDLDTSTQESRLNNKPLVAPKAKSTYHSVHIATLWMCVQTRTAFAAVWKRPLAVSRSSVSVIRQLGQEQEQRSLHRRRGCRLCGSVTQLICHQITYIRAGGFHINPPPASGLHDRLSRVAKTWGENNVVSSLVIMVPRQTPRFHNAHRKVR